MNIDFKTWIVVLAVCVWNAPLQSWAMSDTEAVLTRVSIGYQSRDSADKVIGNLKLPIHVAKGVSLEWASSAPLVVRPDGTVYRPRQAPCISGKYIPVTLTATASKNGGSASREFTIAVVPSNDPSAPLYMGEWEPFWRARPLIGEWLANGLGLEPLPAYLGRHSFGCKMESQKVLYADHLNIVRLLGGWHEGGGAEKPMPADVADLVYRNEAGELQYRWDKLKARLDPYIGAGYTNLTLVLDNIPYCFTSKPVMKHYGQVATPEDFGEWQTFVSNLCVQLVGLYGFETANRFRFRQGTEAQGTNRFVGTQEEYFKIYDHSAAAIKSVLPDAKFGPFNQAGGKGKPSNCNVDTTALARHCATVGTPFDFVSISTYVVKPTHKNDPWLEARSCNGFFHSVQAELPHPIPFEIHECGIVKSKDGIPTGEPGARGAGWLFHLITNLRETGLDRWYHWDVFDRFRSKGGLHELLDSSGWFLAVLDHTAGGEAFVLNTSKPENEQTQVRAIGVFGGEYDWIMAGVFNPDRLSHETETVSIRIPCNLLRTAKGDEVQWTSLNQTNAVHYLVRKDLEEAGMLNATYAAAPEQLASARTMTSKGMRTPEQDFLGGRLERYEQAIVDSLTLKPFPGTIRRNGDDVVFTVTLTPPETAVIRIGPDVFQPLEKKAE
ncbi:MAG: hypothetical protein K9M45_06395 [Kiritimatiellales bacterium]|nr:hypothetical protein [Kiritimatiellales bacterium]